MLNKSLVINEKEAYPVVQGGMGVGVSLSLLSGTVAKNECIGTVSSAFLNRLVSARLKKEVDSLQAAYEEISLAKEISQGKGLIAINVMVALAQDFVASIKGAMKAGVDIIISGAGLPTALPDIVGDSNVALVPIVSSARALEIICKRWMRNKRKPDAVILEGPLAGGHLGFGFEQIEKEEYRLENLFPQVKAVAEQYGNFPVFVAGGIYSYEDILRWVGIGADGVQMGTRFATTEESSASSAYKQAILDCRKENIVVADSCFNPPGSPCGMPFRVINFSPMFINSYLRTPFCNKGYVLQKNNKTGLFTICPAKEDSSSSFCICNGLLSSAGYLLGRQEDNYNLYTVGTNAYRIDRILSVHKLISELLGN